MALAHKHLALGLFDRPVTEWRAETKLALEHVQRSDGKTQLDVIVPRDDNERKLLGTWLNWCEISISIPVAFSLLGSWVCCGRQREASLLRRLKITLKNTLEG